MNVTLLQYQNKCKVRTQIPRCTACVWSSPPKISIKIFPSTVSTPNTVKICRNVTLQTQNKKIKYLKCGPNAENYYLNCILEHSTSHHVNFCASKHWLASSLAEGRAGATCETPEPKILFPAVVDALLLTTPDFFFCPSLGVPSPLCIL